MFSKFWVIFAAFPLMCLGSQSKAQADNRASEIEYFARCRQHVCSASGATFSPDGKTIAYLTDLNGNKQIWTVPVTGGYPQLVTVGEDSIPIAMWSPTNQDLIAFSTFPSGTDNYPIYTIHPDGTGIHKLTKGERTRNFLFGWTPDGKALYTYSDENKIDKNGLYKLAHDGADSKLIWRSEANDLMFSDYSETTLLALLQRVTSNSTQIPFVGNLKSGESVQLLSSKNTRFFGKFSDDGRYVYCITNCGGNGDAFGRIEIVDGKPGKLEILRDAHPGAELFYDVCDIFSRDRSTVALVWSSDEQTDIELLDLKTNKSTNVFNIGGHVQSVDFAPDGKSLALTIQKAFGTTDIYSLNKQTGALKQLTFSPHAGVNFDGFVRPQAISYKSFDGLEIRGWLYKPKGLTGPMPLVISLHGGPQAQSLPGANFQCFLNQGIAVCALNYRGSTGRGQEFMDLDNGRLRLNAVKDIGACGEFLIAQKIADPAKLGVTGHSAGGYLTLMAMERFPNLFTAGLEDNGTVDLLLSAKAPNLEYGDPVKDAEFTQTELSPLKHADQIKAPLGLLLGESDKAFKDALKISEIVRANGVPTYTCSFPNEGHNFYKTVNKIKAETALVSFFVKYLGIDKSIQLP